MLSAIEKQAKARLAVLEYVLNPENSWAKLSRNLLVKRQSNGELDWDSIPDDFDWHSFPSDLTWDQLSQQSLFSMPTVSDATDDVAMELMSQIDSEGVKMTLCIEDSFPKRVLDSRPQPPFLFHKGNFSAEDSAGFAIIGTRKASELALDAASKFASDLVDAGRAIISGLAAGIDTAALESALNNEGRVIAVIGTGIDRYYPKENRHLQDRIADCGLLISQFLPGSAPTKKSFPMRNSVMSSYSFASLVIQADDRSGARLQARIAAEQGRQVFLYEPIMKHEPWAQSMVQNGLAKFVESAVELV